VAIRSVDWWAVHQYVARLIAVEDWPLAGTPEWCALNDSDPRKLAAVMDFGQHHALRVETAQAALAEASRAIAAAVDWTAVADSIHRRATSAAYVPRKVAS
jgi:hypothetical protein